MLIDLEGSLGRLKGSLLGAAPETTHLFLETDRLVQLGQEAADLFPNDYDAQERYCREREGGW